MATAGDEMRQLAKGLEEGIGPPPQMVCVMPVNNVRAIARMLWRWAGEHDRLTAERDKLLRALVYQTYDNEGGGPFWTWCWRGVAQGPVASFEEGVECVQETPS